MTYDEEIAPEVEALDDVPENADELAGEFVDPEHDLTLDVTEPGLVGETDG